MKNNNGPCTDPCGTLAFFQYLKSQERYILVVYKLFYHKF